MYKKIGNSVHQYAQSNPHTKIKSIHRTEKKTKKAGHSKYQEEEIVSLPNVIMISVMMVFVKIPKEAMHNIFMRKPGHKFHGDKCEKENQQIHFHI